MRNAIVDQILMERMNRRGGYDGRDYARGDYGRGGYDGRRGRDYGRDYARGGRDGRDGNYDEERFEDEDEKYLMEMQDGRRGVKGTGRGRRRGRRRDYGETLSLTKSDIMNWKHNLENADGTRGPHFNMEQVMEAAKAVGIRFEDFDERELWLIDCLPLRPRIMSVKNSVFAVMINYLNDWATRNVTVIMMRLSQIFQ